MSGELGRVNLVTARVPDWIKRNAERSNVLRMEMGRLDFADLSCESCRGLDGMKHCEWCQGSGIEWISFVKAREDVMDPKSSVVVVPNHVGRDPRWHISVGHRKRLPSWAELRVAQNRLLPKGVDFCIPFPSEDKWMNLHEFVLHFWEVHDPHLQDDWAQASYDGPTIQEDKEAAYAQLRARGFETPS